ncbi:MAG: transporter associated domain-containing protein, partial [Nanoarchaeota archaeon]
DILGKADIDEINKSIGANFKESVDYDTISGMILKKTGTIPVKGKKVRFGDYVLEVKEVESNRIIKVRIGKQPLKKKR